MNKKTNKNTTVQARPGQWSGWNRFRAKKSLGQNFLKSVLAINKTVVSGEIKNTDLVLEIGPGKGALTKKILESAGRVIAVERDEELIKFLEEKFENEIEEGKLVLVDGDILELHIS